MLIFHTYTFIDKRTKLNNIVEQTLLKSSFKKSRADNIADLFSLSSSSFTSRSFLSVVIYIRFTVMFFKSDYAAMRHVRKTSLITPSTAVRVAV